MERKATAFVEQFGATLFSQWTQQREQKELFWLDAKFLQNVLEEGVAKLPNVAFKGHLTRDLARFGELLKTLLQRKYADHQKTAKKPRGETGASLVLLDEEDVERALAAAPSDEARARIESVLALETSAAARTTESLSQASCAAEFVAVAEQCAAQLRIVRARRFGSEAERDREQAFYLVQISKCVAATARLWCEDTRGQWACDASDKRASERESLRVLLQSLVAADLLTTASSVGDAAARPWTAFFRPQEAAVFRSVDVAKGRAAVYGALLGLAVAFPIVYDDDDDSTSDDDSSLSSDDDEDDDADTPKNRRKARRAKKKQQHVDCVALAKHVVRQVVLAATSEPDAADWYLAVLGAFHSLPKPTKWVADEDDEDEGALAKEQVRVLHDARAELYARAFASSQAVWPARHGSPLALLDALLCLRHAAEFMRVERKQTVPAVATAATQLVGVALPSAFWKWMAHVKKVFAGEHAVVQVLMKKLAKHKAEKKMANVLMQESVLTLTEMRVVVEQFELFLEAEKERAHFVHAPTAEPQDDEGDAPADALFFMDNDGGKNKKRAATTTTTADKKPDARKRGRTQNKTMQ